MTIKEIVQNNKVRFMYYRKGELWYEVVKQKVSPAPQVAFTGYDTVEYDSIFQFPVPISDCGDGQFNAEDKAIMFMRYIRKYMGELEKEKACI